jgi:hypothetical protein
MMNDDEKHEKQLLQELYEIKMAKSAIKNAEIYTKDLVHQYMNDRNTNILITDDFICKRDIRSLEHMKKDLVPKEVWDEYVYVTVYPALNIKLRHNFNN